MTKSQTPNPKLAIGHWSLVITLLLLAWGLRLCCLETVPPGWRDDELINIHALSGELLAGHFPLYFTGASGHEPLYHHLHAGLHAVLGFNVLSGHLLSVACGTLTVALTYVLTRRLFGRATAVITSLMLSTSFWSLMYSRTAIRHTSLPPLALATFYLLWREKPGFFRKTWFLVGLVVGISLYTYPAARLLPVLLVLFAAYLALFHHDRPSTGSSGRFHWRGLLLALAIMAVLAAPLGAAIAQGRSDAATQGIGADARLAELAVPLRELRAGNPRPLLEGIWKTVGMFHATGDPEWLYNIPNRPVFNLLGGALLWAGVVLCLYRWRQPRYFFLLLWLGLGLLPAFVSTPPASLSHTILAQPVAYILPALALTEAYRWLATRNSLFVIRNSLLVICHLSFVILFLTTNAVRDLRDYFIVWPQQDMVRFLYRADYREAARYLGGRQEITDIAVASTLLGPWDRLALEVDVQRDDIAVRLFTPERALIWAAGSQATTRDSLALLTSWPHPAPPIDDLLRSNAGPPEIISPHLTLYTIRDSSFAIRNLVARFANGLELLEARWLDGESLAPGQEAVLLVTWLVAAPLDLPPMPIVANPPPPGVYSGPRLAVFTHLLAADGTFLAGDDGLWVDPLTLWPGDHFVQAHRLTLPRDAPAGPYVLELGLYDPLTGERWAVLDSAGQPVADRILLPAVESRP
ncbi:MAG: glycosyltransferase family 39 protein [Chloroflexota bacterium]|nr:glycosyltransferase family 39 protein [Chloroflexota bacterium]